MEQKYPTKYKICTLKKEIAQVIEYTKQTKICSVDIETDGQDWWLESSYMTCISISFQPGSAYIIPLGHFDSPFKNNWIKILQWLSREIFQNTDIIKVLWNAKFEWRWFKKYGCDMQGMVFDGMLAKYLLDENTRMGLKENTASLLPEFAGYENEIDLLKKKHGGWDKIPLEPLCMYNGIDTDVTLRLMLYFHKKLIKAGFYLLFRNLLMMVCRVLTETEFHGVKVDEVYLDKMIEKYAKLIQDKKVELSKNKFVRQYVRAKQQSNVERLITQVRQEIKDIQKGDSKQKARMIASRQEKIQNYLKNNLNTKEAYDGINYASPKQLIDFFYESDNGLQLPILGKTDTGNPSTDEPTIKKILEKKIHSKKRQFLELLLDIRGLEKLYSTYLVGIKEKLTPEGYLHCSYTQLTVTGRLSCKEPNMQNVPRVTTNPDIKPMFTCPKGFLWFEDDYSQAELRIAAEIAEDATMIDIFKRDFNIHVATAAINNGGIEKYDEAKNFLKEADLIPADQLTSDPKYATHLKWTKEKKRGKTINFGILYEQGDRKLGEGLGVDEKEAAEYKKRWFAGYTGIKNWIAGQHNFVKENGYVMTLWGRKRRLPDIWNPNKWIRLEAQRQSVNAPIQSAAGDFTTFSLVMIREKRLRGELPNYFLCRVTVHDSMDFYIKPEHINKVVPTIGKIAENPDTMTWFGFEMKHVRMKVSPEIGTTWGTLKDYNPWENYKAMIA